jgi:hypothetical protein
MRTRQHLKGLNWSTFKLADGTTKTNYYAWRGGPLLVGKPGTPEFIASLNAALATKIVALDGRLPSLTQAYQRSQQFLSLRERTRADYIKQIVLSDLAPIGPASPPAPQFAAPLRKPVSVWKVTTGG